MKLRGILLGCLGLIVTAPANAQSFSNTIFFGDSNTDSGRYFYLSTSKVNPNLKATQGAYTTNPGPEWSVLLGSLFGIPVTPSSAPGGGNNYAAGGARVVFENATSNAWSTQSQIAAYLSSNGGRADPNALYVYSIGINDLKTSTTGGPGNIVSPSNTAAITTLGLQAAGQVAGLSAAGARYIVVPNTISLLSQDAGTASGFGYGAGTIASARSRALYDQVLWNNLAAQNVPFIPADFNTIYNYVLTHPSQFGIVNTNVNTPACGALVGSLNCGPANYVVPNADRTYFYADGPLSSTGGGHVTTAVQELQAQYVYSLLAAPSQISFLAEVPVKTRATVVSSIFNQVPLSWGQQGAFHGWVSGDVSWLKIDNSYRGFPNDPGTPAATTAGFDYRVSRDLLLGAAFSGATTRQTYSSGGGFRQEEFAVSLYAAYRPSAFWANAVASWGSLRDTVNRDVTLGTTIQRNDGTTRGNNFSFAFETGYDFAGGAVPVVSSNRLPTKAPPVVASPVYAHGPVVGLTLQRVTIDGYTETNPAALTALAFANQTRDSAVTALGYQAYVNLGIWQPFAKVLWNHELANLDRLVTASLTTIAAPAYSLPAVQLGRDWASATLGTRVRFAPNVSGYAAVLGQMGERNVVTYGGQIGLNVAFDPVTVVAKY